MALKSIVEIQVDDTKFQEWLKQTRTITLEVEGGAGDINAPHSSKNPTSPSAPNKVVPGTIYTPREVKEQKRKEKDFQKNQTKFWKEVGTEGLSFSKALASSIKSLGKWTAGLSLVGAYAGAKLGQSVAGAAYKSRGLGVSSGELKSLSINYSALTDDIGTSLSKIQEAQFDLSKQWTLNQVANRGGVDFTGKNPAEIFAAMAPLFKQYVEANPTLNESTLAASGWGQFKDMSDVARTRQITKESIDLMTQHNEADKVNLDLNYRMTDSYIQTVNTLSRAGEEIENSFIKGLVDANMPIRELTESVSATVKTFVGSDGFKELVKSASVNIKEFADYLTTDKFKEDIKTFTDFIGDVAKIVRVGAHPIDALTGGVDALFTTGYPADMGDKRRKEQDEKSKSEREARLASFQNDTASKKSPSDVERARATLSLYLKDKDLSKTGLTRSDIMALAETENAQFDPYLKNIPKPGEKQTSALGLFQSTKGVYSDIYGADWERYREKNDVATQTDTAIKYWELINKQLTTGMGKKPSAGDIASAHHEGAAAYLSELQGNRNETQGLATFRANYKKFGGNINRASNNTTVTVNNNSSADVSLQANKLNGGN